MDSKINEVDSRPITTLSTTGYLIFLQCAYTSQEAHWNAEHAWGLAFPWRICRCTSKRVACGERVDCYCKGHLIFSSQRVQRKFVSLRKNTLQSGRRTELLVNFCNQIYYSSGFLYNAEKPLNFSMKRKLVIVMIRNVRFIVDALNELLLLLASKVYSDVSDTIKIVISENIYRF